MADSAPLGENPQGKQPDLSLPEIPSHADHGIPLEASPRGEPASPPTNRTEPDFSIPEIPAHADHGIPAAPPPSSSSLPSSPQPPMPHHDDPVSPPPVHHGGGMGKIMMALFAVVLLGLGLAAGWYVLGTKAPGTQPASESADDTIVGQKNTILIGGIMPLTGDAASYGLPYQKAAQLAQKEINEAGGIGGKQVEILWEDGQCQEQASRLVAETLIKDKKVDFLLAGACSDEYIGAGPIARDNHVISFSPSATSPKISELGRYIFRAAPSDALAGKVAAQYASTKWQAKTVGIIKEKTEYTAGLADVFTKEFSRLGGTVLLDETFETGTTDFSTIIAKIQAAPPDVLYILPQNPPPGVLVLSALKAARIPSKLLTAEVLLQRDVIAKQAKLLEGLTGIEFAFDDTRPKTQAFFNAYKNEYGLEVTDPAYMAATYDILYLMKEAYEKNGGDTEKMADYLYGLKDWEGAVGKLSFDAHGDPTFPYSIRTVRGDQAVQTDVFTPASPN